MVYSSVFLSHVIHSFKCYMKSHMPDAPGGQRIATTGQMYSLFLGSASDSVPGLGGFGLRAALYFGLKIRLIMGNWAWGGGLGKSTGDKYSSTQNKRIALNFKQQRLSI